jgi:hypothetical protein
VDAHASDIQIYSITTVPNFLGQSTAAFITPNEFTPFTFKH